MATADLVIRIITDTSRMQGLDQAQGKLGKFGGAMQKMALPAGVALGAVVAFGKGAVDAASRTQQAIGAVDSVFGQNAGTVKKWAAGAASSVGLAKSEYMELASVVGAQLKNMGVPLDQVAGKTDELVRLGSDLAATYGGTTKEAVEALGSALRGETDPIERYGVSVKQADIAAQQAKDGTDKLTGAAGKQAKTMALLKLVNKQTADAQGQFNEEQDTAAVQAQIAAAKFEDMKSTLGTALLPIVTQVASKLAELAGWVQKNATFVQVLVGVLAGLATAVLLVNAALKVYRATLIVIQAVQKATFLSNPIFLVIAAVVLLVAAVVILWKKSETFRAIVMAVWKAIKTAALAVGRAIKAAWLAVLSALQNGWKRLKAVASAVWNGIKSVASAVANAIKAVWANAISRIRSILSAFKSAAVGIWNGIKNAIHTVVTKVGDLIGKIRDIKVPGTIQSAFDSIKSAAEKVLNVIKDIINWIKDIPIPKIDWPSPPSWLPGVKMLPPAPAVAGLATRGTVLAPAVPGRLALGGGSGSLTIINVSGAIDPEGTARAIRRVLQGHDRRVRGHAL